jgi:cation transport ATPase
MERASVDKPRLAQLADRIASPFLLAVLAAAAAALVVVAAGPGHALGIAVAVLIVTCPCALSLATPAATLARPARWRGAASWCAGWKRWRPAPPSTPWCSTRPAR